MHALKARPATDSEKVIEIGIGERFMSDEAEEDRETEGAVVSRIMSLAKLIDPDDPGSGRSKIAKLPTPSVNMEAPSVGFKA